MFFECLRTYEAHHLRCMHIRCFDSVLSGSLSAIWNILTSLYMSFLHEYVVQYVDIDQSRSGCRVARQSRAPILGRSIGHQASYNPLDRRGMYEKELTTSAALKCNAGARQPQCPKREIRRAVGGFVEWSRSIASVRNKSHLIIVALFSDFSNSCCLQISGSAQSETAVVIGKRTPCPSFLPGICFPAFLVLNNHLYIIGIKVPATTPATAKPCLSPAVA